MELFEEGLNNTVFFSTAKPAMIFSDMKSLLTNAKVDPKISPSTWKMKFRLPKTFTIGEQKTEEEEKSVQEAMKEAPRIAQGEIDVSLSLLKVDDKRIAVEFTKKSGN